MASLTYQDKLFAKYALAHKLISSNQLNHCQKLLEKAPDPLPLSELMICLQYITTDQARQLQKQIDSLQIAPPDSPSPSSNQPKEQISTPSPGETPTLFAPMVVPPPIEQFGRYKILKLIGQGGMGKVYQAMDTQLERIVALKTLKNNVSPLALNRFLKEAKSVAKLRHPHIIAIHDIGQDHNQYYFTMDFIPGKTLNQVVGDPQWSLYARMTIFLKVLEALEYAHNQGVIHRDIKPHNILLDEQNTPYLMDFGLAKEVESDSFITQKGSVLGTPHYMSPEQARGEIVDVQSDIYSMGVVLYELLTGQKPFPGHPRAVICKVLMEKPPRPTSLNPTLPFPLERIILKAMAKDQQKRFSSCGEFIKALESFIQTFDSDSTWEMPRDPLHRYRRVLLPFYGVGIVVILLLVGLLFSGEKKRPLSNPKHAPKAPPIPSLARQNNNLEKNQRNCPIKISTPLVG